MRMQDGRIVFCDTLALGIQREARMSGDEEAGFVPASMELAPTILSEPGGDTAPRAGLVTVGPYEAFWIGLEIVGSRDCEVRAVFRREGEVQFEVSATASQTPVIGADHSGSRGRQLVPLFAEDPPDHCIPVDSILVEATALGEVRQTAREPDISKPQYAGGEEGPDTSPDGQANDHHAPHGRMEIAQLRIIPPDDFAGSTGLELPEDIQAEPVSPTPAEHDPFSMY